MVTSRSWGRTGRSLGVSPREFDAPTAQSPGQPASRREHAHHVAPMVAARHGIRAGTPVLFIRGVRPNSPMTRTMVEPSRPALAQVIDQAAHRGVEDGENGLHATLETGMIVPAAEGQGHEPDARLDQPPGQ